MELNELYTKLLNHFGPQKWWPAETPFEVVVGAVLTQRTSWNNVELAIKNLKDASILEPAKIANANNRKLQQLVRASGFYKQKTKRLKTVARFIMENGGIDGVGKIKTNELRERLLAINGIGKETADSILLYAIGRPVFVVDAYTQRIFERVGIIDGRMNYNELQRFIEENIEERAKKDVNFYKEFHALIVLLGKTYCKSTPLCEGCPIKCGFRK